MGNILLDTSGLLMKEKRVDSVILNEFQKPWINCGIGIETLLVYGNK